MSRRLVPFDDRNHVVAVRPCSRQVGDRLFLYTGWLYRHQQLLMVVPPWATGEAGGDGTASGKELPMPQVGLRVQH